MPYITQKNRDELMGTDVLCGVRSYSFPANTGELNYFITQLCHEYIQHKGLRYANLNEVIGVLECAKLELYRTVGGPYEDAKREENGSISELDSTK